MLAKRNLKTTGIGNFDFPKPNKPILEIVDFIKGNLIALPNELSDKDIENENGLTQELCDLLNDKAEGKKFWFHPENMEDPSKGNSPRIDLAVKTRKTIVLKTLTVQRKKAYFKIEAKRLPTGTGKREKEYVFGYDVKKSGSPKENGGIERFKKGIHSPDLPFGGIIAYVQNGELEEWRVQVNLWIEELYDDTGFWNKSDQLKLIKATEQLGEYQSKNSRRDSSSAEIVLYHFWVKMN